MKKSLLGAVVAASLLVPSLSYAAKSAPLFFQTGDELFEIEGAPQFEDGYSVGYACQRFGLFGADIWTWDCEIMAVNVEEFSAGELPDEMKEEFSKQYSLSDRKRGVWNHYGAILLGGLLIGGAVVKSKS